jgi:hypothetical protein
MLLCLQFSVVMAKGNEVLIIVIERCDYIFY